MERESLFINRYNFNEEMLKDYVNTFTKGTRLTCFILALVGGVSAYAEYSNNMIFSVALGAISLIMLIIALIYPSYTMRQMKKEGNIFKENTLDFGFSDVITKDDAIESKIKYAEIVNILEGENSIYLMLGKTRGIIVKKDGFVGSDYNEFKNFLDTKFAPAENNRSGG